MVVGAVVVDSVVAGSVVSGAVVSGSVVSGSVVSGSVVAGSVSGGSARRGSLVVVVPGSVVGSGSVVVGGSVATDSTVVSGPSVVGGSVVTVVVSGRGRIGSATPGDGNGDVVTDAVVTASVVVGASVVDTCGTVVAMPGSTTGRRSSLSVLSAPPPVNIITVKTPSTTTHAPAVAARIAPGCCHQSPGGDSYSGSNSHSSSAGRQSSPIMTDLGSMDGRADQRRSVRAWDGGLHVDTIPRPARRSPRRPRRLPALQVRAAAPRGERPISTLTANRWVFWGRNGPLDTHRLGISGWAWP